MRLSRALSAGLLLALACLVAHPSPSRAAGRAGSAELGLDATLALRTFDDTYKGSIPADVDNAFTVDLPVSTVRVGIYATDALEVEPFLGLVVVSQGGDTAHTLDAGLNFLYNFGGAEGGTVPFVALGAGLSSVDFGSGSATQGHFGGGVGLKAPIGDRSAFRLEGTLTRNFENDDYLGSFDIGLALGYSFFTR